jgi:hypothetical protein
MRVLKRVPDWLTMVEQNQALNFSGHKADQAVTDMSAARLVERGGAFVNLTEFGRSVLRRWRDAGVANDGDDDELPRCLVLLQQALAFRLEGYLRIYNFWRAVRDVYDPNDLISNPESLYILSYLNQTVNGYNPWDVIRAASAGGVTEGAIDWDDLKGGTPGLNTDTETAIDNLAKRVRDWATRSTGRVNFCKAMELTLLEPDAAGGALDTWGESDRTRERCLALLPAAVPGTDETEKTVEPTMRLLLERHNVILYGAPGTGKTHRAFALAAHWEQRFGDDTVFRVTFHPTYGYEDFVQGYRPAEADPSAFRLQPGILLEACSRARELLLEGGGTAKVLLIIDEINRGDVSRIFGELITYIEPDKRNVPVRLSQSPKTTFSVPENLYFLGTMNTADKSISLLDVALRRRFAFVEFPPDPSFFSSSGDYLDVVGDVDVGSLLAGLNDRLKSEGIESDRAIGHALLRIPAETQTPVTALRKRFEYDIHPLVVEYCYTDRTRVARILGGLVDSDGRFRAEENLTDEEFIQTLKSLSSVSAYAGGVTTPAEAGSASDAAGEEDDMFEDEDAG